MHIKDSAVVDLRLLGRSGHRVELLRDPPGKGHAGPGHIHRNAYEAERVGGESVEVVGVARFDG